MARFISLLLLVASASAGPDKPVELADGIYRCVLASPGGDLPFFLEVKRGQGKHDSWIINGVERISVPVTKWKGGTLILDIDHYDAKIVANVTGWGTAGNRRIAKTFAGKWEKQSRGTERSSLGFKATHVSAGTPRFDPMQRTEKTYPSIDGRWSVDFSSSKEPAIGQFRLLLTGEVQGTFMTTTGDYRFLAGSYESGRLRLSAFDGAHAFLFDARMQDDGTLAGDFWSRDSWHETWTATSNNTVAVADHFKLTKGSAQGIPDSLAFPDLDGVARNIKDFTKPGDILIIEVFGSWCPNCHDSARHLVELHKKYMARGVVVVGLAFELTGDAARDARQVRRFNKRNGVNYPVLLAGIADKQKSSQALPFLDKLRAYPTAVFVDAKGKIRAVHTGYSGPATGNAQHQLRFSYINLIEQMLLDRASQFKGA